MKFTTEPQGFIERILAATDRLPIPIAETFGAMMMGRAIEGVNNLGIFNYLGEHGPSSVPHICAALDLNEPLVGALLHALAGSAYLLEEHGNYRNTPMTQRFLVAGSPHYVGNFIQYNDQQRMIWLGLEHFAKVKDLRAGKQKVVRDVMQELQEALPDADHDHYNVHHSLRSKKIWRHYMYGLRDLANLSVPELQLYLRFPRRPLRLLDVGGGHGGYSIWMCKRYPDLRATIFDLENAAEIGREIVAQEGLSHRIEYITGDVVQRESLGERMFDVAFCFNLIHHLTPEQNQSMVKKLAGALKAGGSLVLWDEFRDQELKQDQLAKLIGVMFMIASGGDTYSYAQVTHWMKAEGFHRIKQFNMKSAPGTGLLWGRSL